MTLLHRSEGWIAWIQHHIQHITRVRILDTKLEHSIYSKILKINIFEGRLSILSSLGESMFHCCW